MYTPLDELPFPTLASRPSNIPVSSYYKGPPKFTNNSPNKDAPYLGSYGQPDGFVDFTGKYYKDSNDSVPLVARGDVAKALDDAVKEINSNNELRETLAKNTPGSIVWTPTLVDTYITSNTALRSRTTASAPLATYKGSGVGRGITIDYASYPLADKLRIEKVMANNGFARVDANGDPTDNRTGYFEYRGDLGLKLKPDYEAEAAALSEDRATYDQNGFRRHTNRETKDARYKKLTRDSETVAIEASFGSPIPVIYMPADGAITPSKARTKQSVLDKVKKGETVSKLGVVALPPEAKTAIEATREADIIKDSTTSKKKHNVYRDDSDDNKNNCELGLEAKVDMPAQIRFYNEDNLEGASPTQEMDNLTKSKNGYIDCFLLRSMQTRREERYFIFQSLYGDVTTFFFGERPTVYNFSGVLMDTYNQQWFNDFQYFYDDYMRGSQSVLNKTKMVIAYEDQLLEGFMLNMSLNKSAEANVLANFTFDMLLVQRSNIRGYTNPVRRTKIEVDSPADSMKPEDLHRAQILGANIGAVITSAYDELLAKGAELLDSPAFSLAGIPDNISTEDVVQAADTIAEEIAISGSALRDMIFGARDNPGTLNSQSISIIDIKDVSLKDKLILQNSSAYPIA